MNTFWNMAGPLTLMRLNLPGGRPPDGRHNDIDLIKSRLGGIYWHLLSVLTLG